MAAIGDFGTVGLTGLRVLVVEDGAPAGAGLLSMLERLGCIVVAVAGNLDQALDCVLRQGFDVAVLALDLAGDRLVPVAELLDLEDRPFIFAGASAAMPALPDWNHVPIVTEPGDAAQLGAALRLVGPRHREAN